MKKEKMKNIRTGFLSRGISIAKLGLQASAKAAEYAVGDVFSNETVKKIRQKAHLIEQMALVSQELGKLKGSLMKAGQMLSVYGEHFLPPEANQILKTLQSNSPPLEWEEIEKILRKQLKEKMLELEIENEPIAAASLAQVHKAKIISSGEKIVLKVQYPGVDKAIEGDIKAIRKLLSVMNWLPKIPATDQLFLEIKSMLKQELDYEQERAQLIFFKNALVKEKVFIVPSVIEEYSSKKIIAMSYEKGIAVDSNEVLSLPQERKNNIATAILKLYFRELFEWRKIQTDPHFGNYKIRLNNKSEQILLFDYGAVREISVEFMDKYKKMLKALYYSDRAAFEIAAGKLGVLDVKDPQELKDLFYELCSTIVEPFTKDGIYDWKNNDLPNRVTKITWELFKKFPLRSPPRELVFLDRKMAGIFTFLSVMEAKIPARKILGAFFED